MFVNNKTYKQTNKHAFLLTNKFSFSQPLKGKTMNAHFRGEADL
jgi:hypothetical protein